MRHAMNRSQAGQDSLPHGSRKICPLEGSKQLKLPCLQMRPLRELVWRTWYMELAGADIHLAPGDEDIIIPQDERVDGLPLSGLQIKLATRTLLVKRWLKMLDQMLEYDDWANAPLCLVPETKLRRP